MEIVKLGEENLANCCNLPDSPKLFYCQSFLLCGILHCLDHWSSPRFIISCKLLFNSVYILGWTILPGFYSLLSAINPCYAIPASINIIFICIEAWTFIFYKWFLTQHLNEYGIYSDPGIYFLLFTWMVKARVEWQMPGPMFTRLIVWLEAIIFINCMDSTHWWNTVNCAGR